MKKKKNLFKAEDLIIEELSDKHINIIKEFISYEKDLVDFLNDDALRNQIHKISKTFLFFDKSNNLFGYITLSNDSINLNSHLKTYFNNKGIEYKSLPALKIGRLCVDDKYLFRGLGTIMIDFSILIANNICETYSGCRFITLDAKRNIEPKKDPLHFYKKYGFIILKDRIKGSVPMYFDLEFKK